MAGTGEQHEAQHAVHQKVVDIEPLYFFEDVSDAGVVEYRYTDQQTTKKIYVGSNNLLKAYMTTGLSISQIKEKLDNGAQINDDGTIVTVVKKSEIIPEKIPVDEKAVAANSTPKTETMISKTPASIEPQNAETDKTPLIIAFCAGGGVILISGLILLFRKKFTKND